MWLLCLQLFPLVAVSFVWLYSACLQKRCCTNEMNPCFYCYFVWFCCMVGTIPQQSLLPLPHLHTSYCMYRKLVTLCWNESSILLGPLPTAKRSEGQRWKKGEEGPYQEWHHWTQHLIIIKSELGWDLEPSLFSYVWWLVMMSRNGQRYDFGGWSNCLRVETLSS